LYGYFFCCGVLSLSRALSETFFSSTFFAFTQRLPMVAPDPAGKRRRTAPHGRRSTREHEAVDRAHHSLKPKSTQLMVDFGWCSVG